MNRLISIFIFLTALFSFHADAGAKVKTWKFEIDDESGTLEFVHDGDLVLHGVYAEAETKDGMNLRTTDYPVVKVRRDKVNDEIGRGERYILHYSGLAESPDLKHILTFYIKKDFITAELHIVGDGNLSSNYLAPFCIGDPNTFLPDDSSNRALRIPFDNDNFVHYLSSPFPVDDISFEATAIFNGESRNGLIIGSIEHDTWKTGITYKCGETNVLQELKCISGVVHEQTRDIKGKRNAPPSVHGYLPGPVVESSRIFIGFYDDWRDGMEEFGEVNSKIAPPRIWKEGTPFGWNSWAALAQNVNYEGAVSVSDFFKEELQPQGFENDNVVYIGLDSFWDNFTKEQLRDFVKHCEANGQRACIYWCPFSDWIGNPDADVEGTDGKWKYRDIYLRSGGRPRRIESLAVDPTHEGTKLRMKHYISMFRELGFRYLKLDFINNGTLEADSFFDKEIHTGIQAYNSGMCYLCNLCGDDMFLALSIAPVFPAQYGNSRRISCDAWGAMSERDWGSTGYMLNSLSFGWWLDRVYGFNDADHILLDKPDEAADFGDGANRARITSAVITGIYMLGDNFSDEGRLPGNGEARKKALKVATNPEINEIARYGRSFRPVEGYTATDASKAERSYVLHIDDKIYVAIFNFDSKGGYKGYIPLDRLGIAESSEFEVKELWTGETMIMKNELNFDIPPQDVRVFCMKQIY